MRLCRLFLFFSTVTYALTRIVEPDFEGVNFAAALFGKRLDKVFQETTVDSETSCQIQCVKDIRCLSYNFGNTNEKDKFTCQLCDSDRFTNHEHFIEDKKWRYRGMESACESKNFTCGEKEICIPDYHRKNFKCKRKCDLGYTGTPCKPKSCLQVLQSGNNSTGVYRIYPDGNKPITVSCDMTTDGGGWTVFQRRLDGSIDFYRGWTDYKVGFGNLNGEFWLGNDNLHRIAASGNMTLRVDLEDFDGKAVFAEYSIFKVADGSDKYRLLIGGYNGTFLSFHSKMRFSAKDQDNDSLNIHCAVTYKGAWWYNNCHTSNLNGQYLSGPHATLGDGINWKTFRGYSYSLKRSEMKLRPKQ
ncbi:PREDICTED: ficolin-2-like [Acropora digitifera]|uniref:ficolin-2-like n=1 Tax=Acropora digitifera TaxID=70779 RepID=UPI00077A7BDF|nr:PREDICTED: ficolin-2-like [Acropora digitifera]